MTTWWDEFLKNIDVFRQRHATDFAEKAVALRGRKRQYIASSPQGMIAPYAIPDTPLWAETNFSAHSIQRLCLQLLALFDHGPETLVILV